LDFNEGHREIVRVNLPDSGGILGSFLEDPSALAQQVMFVDFVLFVCRLAYKNAASDEDAKKYFSVWRRLEKGTYSDAS